MKIVILRGGHWVNADPLLGVMRTDALRRTLCFRSIRAATSDRSASSVSSARFSRVPGHLLMRRRHAGASNTNNPHSTQYNEASIEWMSEFFKGSSWQIKLPSWTLLADHAQSVWASGLPLTDKLKLAATVARACRWQSGFLWSELKAASRPLPKKR